MTDASRKAKERASRKAKGEKRVEVWLEPYQVSALIHLGVCWGISTESLSVLIRAIADKSAIQKDAGF